MFQTVLEEDRLPKRTLNALWTDVRNVSKSGNAIARIVHPRHSRQWSEAEEELLARSFQQANDLSTSGYVMGTKKDRNSIINAVALKLQRSPAAVKIRMKDLGILPRIRSVRTRTGTPIVPQAPTAQDISRYVDTHTAGYSRPAAR